MCATTDDTPRDVVFFATLNGRTVLAQFLNIERNEHTKDVPGVYTAELRMRFPSESCAEVFPVRREHGV